MNKCLVIVESPTKAKTIGKFLGRNYKVVSSMGHIRDLPKSQLGIDIENNFEPHYITIRGKGDLLKILKKEAQMANQVLYASDPDREGEAIAWHLKQYIEGNKENTDPAPDKLCRVEFNEITKEAVKAAIKNPRAIDLNRFEAQQCRRELDRIVGYQVSPLLWRKVRKGLSAGRVQTVAVRLICEKQKEIDAFVPEEYWTLEAILNHGKDSVVAKLAKIDGKKQDIPDETRINQILADLDGEIFTVQSVKKTKKEKSPQPPFTTSAMQQEANQKLNFTASRTMSVAQQLYEGISVNGTNVGLITYMRTDSVRIASHAQEEALSYIKETFGSEYCPARPKQYAKGKRAQDAHEAIRPTSVLRTPASVKDSLSSSQFRLYKLIWERFVASQMANAQVLNTVYDIQAGKYLFRAIGNIIVFPGYSKLIKQDGKNEKLPELSEGDTLMLRELKPEQHFTQAPSAYTEAGLIKTMEKMGIGRPSTYASIIETIVRRGYVSRKEKTFHPTYLGNIVNDMLMEYFSDIFDVGFTAQMEESLDNIEEGTSRREDVLHTFYKPFSGALNYAEEQIGEKPLEPEVSDVICDKCGKNMVYRVSRYGRFLACPGFPECRNIISVDESGNIEKAEPELSGEVCEKCGKPMVIKKGRNGKFMACSGYPECKNTRSIDEEIGIACTECGGAIVKRRNKRGRIFYGCKNYPDCNTAYWNKPVEEICPVCGRHMVEKKRGEKVTLVCENKECNKSKK